MKSKTGKRMAFVLAVLLIFLAFPLKNPLISADYSQIVTDNEGHIMRVFLNRDEQYCLPPGFTDTLPEKLCKAVVTYEDRYFYYHPGINPVALVRAISQNIKSKSIVSGASTLTMQLARIRKHRKRTLSSKFLEILEALRIEFHYSKKEILKLYLDHAPYGGNIIGYQAASWRYFGKPPQKLSWAEASLLAVLPNAPGIMSPVKNQRQLKAKRDELLKKLNEKGEIDARTLKNSIDEPMPGKVIPFDLRAPHLTRRIHQDAPANQNIVQTTIDPRIQDKVNYMVKRYARQLGNYGIQNAAVIVVENKTHKVRAYVGSQDFYGKAGRVDGVVALRSSGSLLKPYLYALSIHDGLIVPQSQLQDIPTYYGSFSPHNASEMYDGIVTAHDALIRSLNVPAVRLLYTYGHYKFYNFLKASGITTLYRSADDYGLPMIIGGAEVTLWDMARLYSGMANLGTFSKISYYQESGQGHDYEQLIDTASVVMTLNMLKDLRRPGAEYYWNKFNNQFPVAWKTGTSYGHKDAWAIGVNPEWTVAVWVGNFNAATNKNLSGAKSAGPLLFDILGALPKHGKQTWWNLSDYVTETQEVCAITGYAATKSCEKTVTVPVSRKDILKTCPYHMVAEVDSSSNYLVCSKCWEKGHHTKHFIAYPPLVTTYLRKNGTVLQKVPVHNPKCPAYKNASLMAFEYPKPNAKIFVTRDFDGKYQPVVFSVVHQLKDQNIFWYLDNMYIGESKGIHKMAVIPKPGEHVLSLIDAFGNKKSVKFYSTLKRY